MQEEHPEVADVKGAFGNVIDSIHKTAFSIEIQEVICQRNFEGKLLNSKLEFNACHIPELTTNLNRDQIQTNRGKRTIQNRLNIPKNKKRKVNPEETARCDTTAPSTTPPPPPPISMELEFQP